MSNTAGTLAAIISTMGIGLFIERLGSFQSFLTLTSAMYIASTVFWVFSATGERVFHQQIIYENPTIGLEILALTTSSRPATAWDTFSLLILSFINPNMQMARKEISQIFFTSKNSFWQQISSGDLKNSAPVEGYQFSKLAMKEKTILLQTITRYSLCFNSSTINPGYSS